jgi:hypothetical protein
MSGLTLNFPVGDGNMVIRSMGMPMTSIRPGVEISTSR